MVVYSVIIPAYNEQVWLTRSLPALREAMHGLPWEGEVIVVDNNSTDQTAQVAREHGARVVFEPRNQISRARNAGARVARGRYLVFLDADTYLSRQLLQTALRNLDERTCCGGGALVDFDQTFPRGVRWMLPSGMGWPFASGSRPAVSSTACAKLTTPPGVSVNASLPRKKSGFHGPCRNGAEAAASPSRSSIGRGSSRRPAKSKSAPCGICWPSSSCWSFRLPFISASCLTFGTVGGKFGAGRIGPRFPSGHIRPDSIV